MAVNIDELQVETQPAAPSPQAQAQPAAQQSPPQLDLKAEMEKLRERELRLQAD
jgi:hypothetical protein